MLRLASILLLASTAAAEPLQMTWHGRVFTADGVPYDGPGDVTVTLRPDVTTTSTPLWTDTFSGVSIVDGYVQVVLGSGVPLDLAAFPSDPPYVQVDVDGLTVLGSARLYEVPYAVRAQAFDLSVDATCDADHAGRLGLTAGGGVQICAGADGWLVLDTVPAP